MHRLLLPIMLFFAASSAVAQNNLILHEPFDYATLNPLNWAENEGDNWAGSWERAIGDDIIILPSNLEYNGMSFGEGNHLGVNIELVGTRYDRSIQNIPDTGQVIWTSVLMNFAEGTNANSVGNITLTKNGDQVFSFGKKFGNEKFGLVWPGATNYNTNVDTEGLHWLLIKIQFSGDNTNESAWFWIDPATDSEPDEAEADLAILPSSSPSLKLNFGIDGVQVKAEGNTPIFMDLDEFRLGKTFAAVNPFFTTNTNELLSTEDFKIFPNPTSQSFTLNFQSRIAQNINIKIFSIDGKVVFQEEQGFLPAGKFQKQINLRTANLNSGMYIIQLIGAEGVLSKKLYFNED